MSRCSRPLNQEADFQEYFAVFRDFTESVHKQVKGDRTSFRIENRHWKKMAQNRKFLKVYKRKLENSRTGQSAMQWKFTRLDCQGEA